MASVSATSASVEGFKIIKENPAALGIWLIVYLALGAVIIGLVGALVGFSALSAIPQYAASAASGVPDLSLAQSLVASFLGIIVIALPLFIVVETVLVTAVKRAVLRPEQKSPGYIRLGMDEVRVFLVRLVRAFIYIAIQLVCIVGGILLYNIHPLLTFLWALAGIAALIFVAVRLSLAASQTFATGQFNLMGSWALTKGRFWPLFGAYLLAFVYYVIISFVLGIITSVASGGGMAAMMSAPQDPAVAVQGFGIVILIQVVTSMIQQTFYTPVCGAPPAAIYRDLTATPADAF